MTDLAQIHACRAVPPTAPRYKASQTSGCGPILGTDGINDDFCFSPPDVAIAELPLPDRFTSGTGRGAEPGHGYRIWTHRPFDPRVTAPGHARSVFAPGRIGQESYR